MELEVDTAVALRASVPGQSDPAALGEADDPETPGGKLDLVVWAPDGYLSELEVYWYGSHPPADLPDPRLVRVGPGPPTTHV